MLINNHHFNNNFNGLKQINTLIFNNFSLQNLNNSNGENKAKIYIYKYLILNSN